MNVNTLINKYGERGEQNGVPICIFIDSEKTTFYQREKLFKKFSGLGAVCAFVKERVEESDRFKIGDADYLVLSSMECKKSGARIYSDLVLFKDDFDKEIQIFKQALSRQGCNLPSIVNEAPVTLMARVKTAKHNDYLEYAMHSERKPTHVISVQYRDLDIQLTDLIKWGDRSFEVLGAENIDELNRLIYITCIEVLSG